MELIDLSFLIAYKSELLKRLGYVFSLKIFNISDLGFLNSPNTSFITIDIKI